MTLPKTLTVTRADGMTAHFPIVWEVRELSSNKAPAPFIDEEHEEYFFDFVDADLFDWIQFMYECHGVTSDIVDDNNGRYIGTWSMI